MLATLAFGIALFSAATAAEIMPNFATVPTGWTVDRYQPASFSNVGTFQGQPNVLGIGIDATTSSVNRPLGQQGTFYNTQGRAYEFSPVVGPNNRMTAFLYIPASWAVVANGDVRSDMWGVLVDGSNVVTTYPIIGFTNYNGSPRFRVFDGDVGPDGWVNLAATVNYDAWNKFSIELVPGAVNFYANGTLVYTDSVIQGGVAIKSVIMQAYNFDHPTLSPAATTIAPYTAHWSNGLTTVVDDDGAGTAANCDAVDPASTTIADAYSVAAPGDTVTVCPGTYANASTINLNKANTTITWAGTTKPVIQSPNAPANLFSISASGVTLSNLEIQKTDPHSPSEHNLIAVGGNNFTASNNLIYGPNPGGTWSAVNLYSRAFVISALTGTLITNNVIHTFRQPGYMSGGVGTGGTISNNQVSGTRGWVVEGGDYLFTGNSWGEPQNQGCDIALLGTIIPANQTFYLPLLTLSSTNDNAFICQQFGAMENGRATGYVDDSAGGGGNGSDNANYQTINGGVAGTLIGGTVQVAGGTYNEDVVIGKTVKVLGAGAVSTTVSGPIGGNGMTVQVLGSNVEFSGFTVTRAGNNSTDWNDPGLNFAGLQIQGAQTGALVHDNNFTGNRSAIDVNNSSGHTFRNNVIDNNHTGVIFRNQTDNMTFVENTVTNNRTVGVLFLDASGGTNSPVQTAANCTFFNNNFSGNWYGGIVDRQSGGSLPVPGTTNLKNFSGNWYGTNAPVVTIANSAEPPYGLALCPAGYPGCTATNPGGAPDIAGPASANFDYSPFMNDGTDTNVETVLNRGTYGFQGSFNSLSLSATSAQVGAISKIQEGVDLVNAGGTLNIPNGTYPGDVDVNKALTIQGTFTVGGSFTTSAAGVVVKPGTSPGIITSGNLTFGPGTDVDIELNGVVPGSNHDQFDVTGTVLIAPAVDLNISVGYVPGAGHSYTIINNDGVDPVGGAFFGLPDGTVFFVGPYSFQIDYNGGDGNDVVISAVANCNAVSIPTNITTLTGVNVNVPVNVDDTTGNGLLSTDFTLTYNPAVITTPVVSLGTVTAGSVLTVNYVGPGTMVVSIFQATPWTGAGTLANIQFSVVGLPGTSSPVAFSAFKFNEGTPCSSASNGLVTVISGTITGTVTYGNVVDLPAAPRYIPDVTLSAVGSVNTSALTPPAPTSNGMYTLSGMGAGPYTVTPSKVGGVVNFLGGGQTITSFDSAMIARHVVGFTTPTPILPFTAAQIAAADVSGTGGVTSFDAALIARWVAGLPGFGNTATWVFTPTNRAYANVNTDQTGQDYTAILMGDATGNYHQGLMPARPAPLTDKEAIVTSVPKMTAQSGDIVTVPVTISDTTDRWVNSYQFELTYDADLLEPAAQPVDVAGTLSESYVATVNAVEPGRLVVVMFGVNPLSGAGNLINLRFNVIGRSGVTEIGWNNMLLNEGNPRAAVVAGQIRVMPDVDEEDQPVIGGRILTANGQAVTGAVVTATDTSGKVRTVVSNVDGVFRIRGIEPGQSYTLTVQARQYAFSPITVSAGNRLTITDLIAQP